MRREREGRSMVWAIHWGRREGDNKDFDLE
jgi:hypothetical protein